MSQHLARKLEDFFVVAVTVLRQPQIIKSAYAMGARSYLSKPIQEEEVQNLVQHYRSYWELNTGLQQPRHSI